MRTYSTIDGDTVDLAVWRHYGRQSPALLRAVFAENPGLSLLPAMLPPGTQIVMPSAPTEPAVSQSGGALWD